MGLIATQRSIHKTVGEETCPIASNPETSQPSTWKTDFNKACELSLSSYESFHE